jgi:hypothetical protein
MEDQGTPPLTGSGLSGLSEAFQRLSGKAARCLSRRALYLVGALERLVLGPSAIRDRDRKAGKAWYPGRVAEVGEVAL